MNEIIEMERCRPGSTEFYESLRRINKDPADRDCRVRLADWFERLPVQPVQSDKLPKWFNRFWHRSGLSKRFQSRRSHGGSWASYEIAQVLGDYALFGINHFRWFDHWGSTEIFNTLVLVGEPYQYRRDDHVLLDVCCKLQEVLGKPVTFSRRADWHVGCVRIVIWFTFEE